MPWNLPTGKPSTKSAPIFGVMTYKPSRLRELGQEFVVDTPAEAVSPVSVLIFARIASAISVADAIPCKFWVFTDSSG